MRILIAILLLMASAVRAEPVKYILDTDIASDCDDAGAVAVVNALADRGEVEILAMMASTGGRYCAGALCAINTWYGRGDVPIGMLKDEKFWTGGLPADASGAYNFQSYNRWLAENCANRIKSADEVPDAVKLYRKILSEQEDGNVVINTIGPLPNMAGLMASSGDEYSKLSGMELIKAKVKVLVITGGRNPEGTSSNFSKAGAGKYAKPVIDGWPGKIVFVGNEVGGKMMTSWKENKSATEGNPARLAYREFFKGKEEKAHPSLDQAGVLYAIRGEGEFFMLEATGYQSCDEKGKTKWVEGSAEGKQHAYLKKREGVEEKVQEVLQELMTAGRKTKGNAER